MIIPSRIDVADVAHVYRGRSGCACGCRGTHSVPARAAGSKEAEYRTVSDRRVETVVNDLNRAIAAGEDLDFSADHVPYVARETDGRVIIAYFPEGDAGAAIVAALRDSTAAVRETRARTERDERRAAVVLAAQGRVDGCQAYVDAARESLAIRQRHLDEALAALAKAGE